MQFAFEVDCCEFVGCSVLLLPFSWLSEVSCAGDSFRLSADCNVQVCELPSRCTGNDCDAVCFVTGLFFGPCPPCSIGVDPATDGKGVRFNDAALSRSTKLRLVGGCGAEGGVARVVPVVEDGIRTPMIMHVMRQQRFIFCARQLAVNRCI